MKRVLGVLGLVAGLAGWGRGQECRTLPQAADDAVVAAPANHTVLFEDADVRVLDVHSQPGTREAVHTHRLPSAMYIERSGAGTYDSADGKVHRSHETDPNFKPEVRAIQPEGPHYTTNTGDVPFHAIRVEFKHPGCGLAGWKAAAPGTEAAVPGETVLLENAEVRVVDVRLAAGAKEAMHGEAWPGVVYVAEGGPVRVGKQVSSVGIKIVPVDGGLASLENAGKGPLHLVWFELKFGSGK